MFTACCVCVLLASLSDPLPEGALARVGVTRYRPGDHFSETSDVQLSPDGKLVAVSTTPETVTLLDAATGRRVAILTPDSEPEGGIAVIRFSADGKHVALLTGKRIRVWDVAARKHLRAFDFEDVPSLYFRDHFFSVGGGYVAVFHNVPWVGRISDGKLTPLEELPCESYYGLDLSPDGKHLAVVGYTYKMNEVQKDSRAKQLRLYDPADGSHMKTHEMDRVGHHVKFVGDSDRAAVSHSYDGHDCYVYDRTSGKVLNEWKDHPFAPIESADGRALLWMLTSHHPLSRSTDGGKTRETARVRGGECTTAAFLPDNTVRLARVVANAVEVWDWPPEKGAKPVARSPLTDTASKWGVIRVGFTADGKTLRTLAETDENSEVLPRTLFLREQPLDGSTAGRSVKTVLTAKSQTWHCFASASADLSVMAAGCWSGGSVWNTLEGEKEDDSESGGWKINLISDDGRYLIVGDYAWNASVVRIETGESGASIKLNDLVSSVALQRGFR